MSLPEVETVLPELSEFVTRLREQCETGDLANWKDFGQAVRAFFSPAAMAQVERYVPSWGQMAQHADQQTLIHVTSVLVALQQLPEYQQAAADQQRIMQWMTLFHDVAKVPRPGQHDYVHGFRSAAQAGKGLAQAGFPVSDGFAAGIDDWSALTYNAVICRGDLQEEIQDNSKLPDILAGIDALYGAKTAAAWIIRGALLHLSILTDPDYPTVAPLTDDEARRYLEPAFLPLLKMMMLVDADAWNLYDPVMRERHRQQTIAVFERLAATKG